MIFKPNMFLVRKSNVVEFPLTDEMVKRIKEVNPNAKIFHKPVELKLLENKNV